MWSGKSAELIKELLYRNDNGFDVHAFNSNINKRERHCIKSRDGSSWPAEQISDESLDVDGDLIRRCLRYEGSVIAVDEGQFFGDNLSKLAIMARRRNAKFELIVAGLLLDSENRPFGPMATLRSIANRSIDVTAWCECDAIARFTFSKTIKEGQVRVGDEGFEARCELCYSNGEAVKASLGYVS